MRFTVISMLLLAACTTDPTTSSNLPNCASFPTAGDILCDGASCSYRGTACALDECGMPPVYPGYAISPQPDGSVQIVGTVWTPLAAWIDETRPYQQCEIARAK